MRELITRLVEKEKAARPASATEVLSMLKGMGPGFPADDLAREEELDAAETMAIPPEVVEPMPVEQVGQTLESAYVPEGMLMEQHTGANRIGHAKAPPGGRWWLHVLHPPLVADRLLFDKLRVGATRLQRHPGQDCLRPVAFRAYEDATVLIMPAPGGMVLAELLKLTGKCSFAAALPLLRRIAETSDRLVLDGLPGVELRANRIFVSPEAVAGGESFQLALVPQLLPQEETRDLASMLALGDGMSNTITLELLEEEGGTDGPVPLFARLVYRLVAGRDCVAAASASDRAYVRVAELSEKNNTLLRQIIAGQTQRATCAALLAELQGLGGSTGSFIHSGGKSRSATDSALGSRPRSEPFPSVAAASASAIGSRPGSAVSSAAAFGGHGERPVGSLGHFTAGRCLRCGLGFPLPAAPSPAAGLARASEVEVDAVAPRRSRGAWIGAIVAVLAVAAVGIVLDVERPGRSWPGPSQGGGGDDPAARRAAGVGGHSGPGDVDGGRDAGETECARRQSGVAPAGRRKAAAGRDGEGARLPALSLHAGEIGGPAAGGALRPRASEGDRRHPGWRAVRLHCRLGAHDPGAAGRRGAGAGQPLHDAV